jgi:alanine racemase
VYTHLARADEPDRTTTEEQVRLLLATVEQIESRGVRIPYVHASNTAGALNFPAARLGAMRVGIGLYGYDPSRLPARQGVLRPALTLTSRLTRVTPIAPGTGVGYGHEFRPLSRSIVGLVPIGYGDGLPRQLGLGCGQVLIAGKRAPIVGRVSMDQITVDLTGIEGAAVGDGVVLIGESGDLRQTADDLGDQAGTISYDVLTGLLPRVPRVYRAGSGPVGVARMGRYRPLPASIQ